VINGLPIDEIACFAYEESSVLIAQVVRDKANYNGSDHQKDCRFACSFQARHRRHA